MMGGVSAPTLIFGAAAAVVLFVDVVYGKNLLRHDVSPAPPPPTVGISYMHPFGSSSSSSSSSNIGRSITRSMPGPPYHYYSVGSRRHLEIGESAKEELVRALQEDHQVTVVGPVEGGNVLCDSLVAAENATTLPFSLHEGEVIVAERLAYFATKNGDVFTDGMARKVWLGAVTHPPQGEGETVAWRVSMAWGEECDPETVLLKTTKRYTDGTTGITKTVPCGGSATHTCMVQLLVDFDDPGEELFQAGVMAGGTNIFSNAPTDSTRGLGGVAGNQPGRTYPLTRKIFSDLGLEEPTDTVVDVMVLYSAKSLTAMGNVSPEQMETIIYESLAWTNQAFVNSRVSVRFNPVHIGQLPYEETSLDGKGTLSNLRQNEDVASLRDATGADLVQMVGHFTDGACGWGDVYTGDEALGFSLVKATCLDNHAHTHEFGRNLGCRDDRESTGVETGRGHGLHYCDGPSPYRTIMSHSCGSPVVNYFSNPAVSYVGRPTGTTEQDNAGVIEENMVDVSNFRDRAAPPPSGPPSTIVTPLRTALRSAKASTSASSASASQINALSPSTKRRPRFLQEEDIRLMKVMFDFYDQDRDGKLTPSQACLLCTTLGFHPVEISSIRCSDEGEVDFKQLVQSAGFVRANQSPPGARGGTTKHFYRMATRNASHSMTSEQVHHFFESIGVDIPQPAVDRITTTVSSEGDTCLKEDELVEYVERIRKRQDAMVANQQGGPTRSQTSRNVPRGGARGR